MEATKMSIDRGMHKENVGDIYIYKIIYVIYIIVLYIYNTIKYYSAIKKEGNNVICSNMDEPWGHYALWNKSEKERQILYVITYMCNLLLGEWIRKMYSMCTMS